MPPSEKRDETAYYWPFGARRISETVARRFRILQWLVGLQLLAAFGLGIWVTVR